MATAKKKAVKKKVVKKKAAVKKKAVKKAKKDNIGQLVVERALLAKEAGLDGVVASSQEAAKTAK